MKKVMAVSIATLMMNGCMMEPRSIHPTDAIVRTITKKNASGQIVTEREEVVESHETPRYNGGYGYPAYSFGWSPFYPSPIRWIQQQNMYQQGWGGGFGGSAFFNFR